MKTGVYIQAKPKEELILPNEWVHLKEQYEGIGSMKRRKEWLGIRLWLAELTSSSLPLQKNKLNKPFLVEHPELGISISHSNNYQAVKIAHEQHVGIDLQEYSEVAVKIQTKFIHSTEWLVEGRTRFTEFEFCNLIWSAKEALFKSSSTNPANYKETFQLTEIRFIQGNEYYFQFSNKETGGQSLVSIQVKEEYIFSETIEY